MLNVGWPGIVVDQGQYDRVNWGRERKREREKEEEEIMGIMKSCIERYCQTIPSPKKTFRQS